MTTTSKNPQTLALHGGTYRSDPATGSVAVPIYQTTSYQFRGAEHAANLFGLKEFGNIYTRIMNPTNAVLEERIAALEGGVAALGVSSGQAASAMAIQNIAQAGDNIVSSTDLYGGTWNLFANTFKTQGIEVRFVDPADPENFRKATDKKTRAYYAETLPNPKLHVFPIKEVADIGRSLGVPLIMDNTACPILCKPFEHGAAIIVYSTTKYVGGHGTSIGGLLVDSGNFDWEKHAERFPLPNQPDPSYHGAVWTQAVKPLGPIAYIIKARVTIQRDLGYAMSPFNAFQFIQGLETLPLRMREHCRNAQAVADYLVKHPAVTRVIYPSQQTGEFARRAKTYLNGGLGGLLGFELKGGKAAGRQFIDALKLFYHVANIGDARSLAIHPATTTHSQLTAEEQIATGVSENYVRLSVGIEHIDDILTDLEQALGTAGKVPLAAYPAADRVRHDCTLSHLFECLEVCLPISLPNGLPARQALAEEGVEVLADDELQRRTVRPLRVCLVNLMPNKVVTETQICRLFGATSIPVAVTLCVPDSYRSKTTADHVASFYRRWSQIRDERFDGLVVDRRSGRNLAFEDVTYWSDLRAMLDWAKTCVASNLYICWAAQAALHHFYGVPKQPLPAKISGVFHQRITSAESRLLKGFGAEFPVPVSRYT